MPKQHSTEPSVSRIVFWPLYAAGRFLFGILLLSIVALVISIAASRQQYAFQLDGVRQPVTPAYMEELNRRSLDHAANSWLATKLSDYAYTLYFRWTGIHNIALGQSEAGFFRRIVQHYPDDTAIAMLAARLFGMRTANVILIIPLVAIVIVLASIDGLAERAIRRECGGHESDTRFHFARRFGYTLLPPVMGLIYLCLPIDMSPGTVLLPALAVMAVLVRTKMKYYKKYL